MKIYFPIIQYMPHLDIISHIADLNIGEKTDKP